MTMITPNNLNRYYLLTDYGDADVNHGCDLTTFPQVCEELIERHAQGYESTVFRMEVGEGALMSVDVTDDAIARVKDMPRWRGEPYPEWLDGGESAAQAAQWAAEDAAHERQERSQLEVL